MRDRPYGRMGARPELHFRPICRMVSASFWGELPLRLMGKSALLLGGMPMVRMCIPDLCANWWALLYGPISPHSSNGGNQYPSRPYLPIDGNYITMCAFSASNIAAGLALRDVENIRGFRHTAAGVS